MGFRGGVARIVAALAVVGLYACEAPLVLDHVRQQQANPTQRSDLFQAAAGNDTAIVVVGNRGTLVSSLDDGKTWQRQTLDGQPFLLDVVACPDGSFVALAYENEIHIGDAEAGNWRRVAIDSEEVPQAVTCDPQGRIWVVGSFSSILSSADQGATWSASGMDEDLHFTTVQFVDRDTAFLTGEFGVVVQTTDGGVTWENLSSLPDEFYPQDAWFRDADTGWIVGLTGTVLRTDDGGRTWRRQDAVTHAPLYTIVPGNDGLYVVGGFGTVLQSATGDAWSIVEHDKPVRFYLRGAFALDGGRLVAAGGAGALFVIEI